MISAPQSTGRSPKIELISQKAWPGGMFTRLDTSRVPNNGIARGENTMLDQDGTITQRPGLRPYGTQPTGTVMGLPYEFVRFNTSVTPNTIETWLIWFENRSGVGTIVCAKNGGAQSVATGFTYNVANAKPHFEQVYGKVLITTGVDYLTYMDVQTFAITAMTALSSPGAINGLATGIGGSVLTLRYRYAATNQGETAASAATTVGVSTVRSAWSGTSQYVTITGDRVANATGYNIYVGDSSGFEYYLARIPDPGSGTTWSYVDIGTTAVTPTRIAPAGDSTAGPKVTRATNIKGKPYLTGDTTNPDRIWFGGDLAESALDLSSFNGGGWISPNKGGKDFPVVVKPFRDGKGTPTAVAFSKGTNGAGKRYLLQPQTLTVGSTLLTYMACQEDNGQEGTDAPDGVVMLNDGAWYPSRSGFKTTNSKANIPNILGTDTISDNIGNDVSSLSALNMESCVGLAYDRSIYWSVPYGSTTNNQIWVLHLRQGVAWMRPWSIKADALWLYADNSDGLTKMMALVNNKFYVFDKSYLTNDDGVAFPTSSNSGSIRFSDDGAIWGSVIDVTFYFLKPQGNINLTVNAQTEDGAQAFTDTMPGAGASQATSWGRNRWGTGWGRGFGSLIPVSSRKTIRKWTIDIDEECSSLDWAFSTTDSGVSYQLDRVVVRFANIGFKEVDNS